jgi:hypothetical protein
MTAPGKNLRCRDPGQLLPDAVRYIRIVNAERDLGDERSDPAPKLRNLC